MSGWPGQRQLTLARLAHRVSFCTKCRDFLQWDRLKGSRLSNSELFYHHPTGGALKDSAQNSCRFCLLLYEQLKQSRRPADETELPDRRIRLSVRYPNLECGRHKLHVSVEPADTQSAGLHDISKVDRNTVTRVIIQNDIGESIVPLVYRLMASTWAMYERLGQTSLWVVECEPISLKAYFRIDREISEDEFFAEALPFWSTELDLWQLEPDADAIMTMSLKCEDKGTNSDAVFWILPYWLLSCRVRHPYCKAGRNERDIKPLLPKRVIDLGPAEDSPFSVNAPPPKSPVLVCPPPGTRAQYATLSHCWGRKPPIRTLTSNISCWLKEIPWGELPQTFKDAFDITRKLGMRYLWIDSLCIIQDSEEDWRDQSARMGDIYRRADICISASQAKDSSEGIYHPRGPLAFSRPERLWDCPPPGLCMQAAGARAPVYAFPTRFQSEPDLLGCRGWVLQEELLSPRRIIFGKYRVWWECLTMEAETYRPLLLNGVPDTFEYEGHFNWRQFFHAGISGLLENLSDSASSDVSKFYKTWLFIIHHYSRRKLTKGSDRLAALAGIATEFQSVTKDQYLCGLWGRYLWRQLLWCVVAPSFPAFNLLEKGNLRESRRMDDFSCPSWSWAGIEAPIRLFPIHPPDEFNSHTVLVELLRAECTPSSPADISNSYHGSLILRGPIAKAVARPFSPSLSVDKIKGLFPSSDPTPRLPILKQENSILRGMEEVLHKGEEFGVARTPHVEDRKQIAIVPRNSESGGAEASVEYAYNTAVSVAIDRAIMTNDLSSLPPWTKYRAWLNDQGYNPLHETRKVVQIWREENELNDIRSLDPDMESAKYCGHPIFDPDIGQQVGYWAPDLPTSRGEDINITCLAISRHGQVVYCLGLERVERSDKYRRIGVVYWLVRAWERRPTEPESIIEII